MENEFAEVFCMANVKTNYTKSSTEYRHGHRITECAPGAPLFGGNNPLTADCGRCKWLRPINSMLRFTFCGYLYETGQKRGCPPGADCMRKEELPPSETDGSGTSTWKGAGFDAKDETEPDKAARTGTEAAENGTREVQTA